MRPYAATQCARVAAHASTHTAHTHRTKLADACAHSGDAPRRRRDRMKRFFPAAILFAALWLRTVSASAQHTRPRANPTGPSAPAARPTVRVTVPPPPPPPEHA